MDYVFTERKNYILQFKGFLGFPTLEKNLSSLIPEYVQDL